MKTLWVTGCIVVFAFCMSSTASAESYIGILLDGYQKDCIVQSRGEDYDCKESRQLYAGDKVTKKPAVKSLKIKWAPYASGKELDATSLMVVFEPPKDKKGILQGVKEVLGLVKTGHTVFVGATRAGSDEPLAPQPGNNATVLSGQNITFAWESGSGKHIIFKDSKGVEVFKKELKGEASIQLSPDEIGMKAGETYTWFISGSRSNRLSNVLLLPQDVSNQITDDLNQIDKEVVGNMEKTIRKAVYLQFMSDAYPREIDLYWLSYRLLKGMQKENALKKEDMSLLEELKNNYLRHVRETM